ncbi:hypothetical protein RJ639_014976 [Escallonia herrerae]|uniref:Retrotransposon Copia-like N-terminal domain-containing protein n=1 Tax=Escallonia herrerae TaxID=1293975 RepID=A0AA89ALL4_9ASTE|nr:hypothetical protein RJ639_014976 [Escallonia herrerae]
MAVCFAVTFVIFPNWMKKRAFSFKGEGELSDYAMTITNETDILSLKSEEEEWIWTVGRLNLKCERVFIAAKLAYTFSLWYQEQATKPNFFSFQTSLETKNGKSIGDLVASANDNQSKAIDITSLYYLHPSDHPGLIFVTHPLSESGDNYFTWRRSFMNSLRSKNKASFVDGTTVKSEIDFSNL